MSSRASGEDLPEGEQKVALVRAMFDTIAPRYNLVNDLMTFGLDRGWRRTTVRRLLLPPGALVLDLACGTGDLLRDLERAEMRGVGADLSLGMLERAGDARDRVVQADGVALSFATDAFDGLVCGFALRNFAALADVFAEAARVLRPGGRIALLEVDRPSLPLLRAGHRLWLSVAVPRLGALLSDPAAYRYLPRSLAYLPSPPALTAMLETAGFTRVERHRLSAGIVQVVTATCAGGPLLSVSNERAA